MLMKPNDLYKMTPERVIRNVDDMEYYISRHISEVDMFDIEDDVISDRLELRIIRDPYIDGNRTWTLSTLWFDNKPVMVLQSAGRAGRDYNKSFVTDLEAYGNVVSYIATLINATGIYIHDADTDYDDLVSFYGNKL